MVHTEVIYHILQFAAPKQGIAFPENTRHLTNVDLRMAQRRKRWANLKSTLVVCIVFHPGRQS